jgi:hypothetical protein
MTISVPRLLALSLILVPAFGVVLATVGGVGCSRVGRSRSGKPQFVVDASPRTVVHTSRPPQTAASDGVDFKHTPRNAEDFSDWVTPCEGDGDCKAAMICECPDEHACSGTQTAEGRSPRFICRNRRDYDRPSLKPRSP